MGNADENTTYVIIEMQTNDGITAIVTPATYTDRNQAESKFHLVLASAAISSVEKHTCMMLTSDGKMLRSECYKHPKAEPEEESEGE